MAVNLPPAQRRTGAADANRVETPAGPINKPAGAEQPAQQAWAGEEGGWAAKTGAVQQRRQVEDTSPLVLMVRQDAIRRAGESKHISTTSNLYSRLENHYLADLMQSDAPIGSSERKQLGRAAIDKLGKVFVAEGPTYDYWENGATTSWNKQEIPEGVRHLIRGVPKVLAAATDVLSQDNRPHLSYLDVPHLLGAANEEVGADADIKGGGKNISQLMHWATGVKYAPETTKDTMRELFMLYELWHLETWDVFGEDALNDLIAEEQGSLFGRKLAAGEVTKENLPKVIDETFGEARAWVGAMLKVRQPQLDAMVDAGELPQANLWYGQLGQMDAWNEPSFKEQLASGKTMDEVRSSSLAKRLGDVYALIYEAEAWDRNNPGNPMTLTPLTESMLKGKYDEIMRKTAHGEKLKTGDVMGAMWNAGRNVPLEGQ